VPWISLGSVASPAIKALQARQNGVWSTGTGSGKVREAVAIAPAKLTTAQIADRATPSVVIVENFNEDGEKAEQGSGYVFSVMGLSSRIIT